MNLQLWDDTRTHELLRLQAENTQLRKHLYKARQSAHRWRTEAAATSKRLRLETHRAELWRARALRKNAKPW